MLHNNADDLKAASYALGVITQFNLKRHCLSTSTVSTETHKQWLLQ